MIEETKKEFFAALGSKPTCAAASAGPFAAICAVGGTEGLEVVSMGGAAGGRVQREDLRGAVACVALSSCGSAASVCFRSGRSVVAALRFGLGQRDLGAGPAGACATVWGHELLHWAVGSTIVVERAPDPLGPRAVMFQEAVCSSPVVCLSARGRRLAAATDSRVHVFAWEGQPEERLSSLAVLAPEQDAGGILAVSLSPDNLVAVGCGDGGVRCWSVRAGAQGGSRPLWTVRAGMGDRFSTAVRAVSFSPNGELLAFGGLSSQTFVVHPMTGRELDGFDCSHKDWVCAVLWTFVEFEPGVLSIADDGSALVVPLGQNKKQRQKLASLLTAFQEEEVEGLTSVLIELFAKRVPQRAFQI